MNKIGLKNPLGLAKIVAQLEASLLELGYTTNVSSDMRELNEYVQRSRGRPAAPMHNFQACDFSNERAFWVSIEDRSGITSGIQSFRCDQIETSLADWCLPYMIGIYMRCRELMIPTQMRSPKDSIAERLKGSLVYQGELWVDRQTKNRKVFEYFTRLGLLLTMMKWNPDAIWALIDEQVALHGHPNRVGYTTVEKGFLRWEWKSEGVSPVEYLVVIERSGLEQMIDSILTTQSGYPLARPGIRYSLLEGH
jgi:hypothetical protein